MYNGLSRLEEVETVRSISAVLYICIDDKLYYLLELVSYGDIAQLGERCVRIAEVGGSNPPISTRASIRTTEVIKNRIYLRYFYP